MTDLDGRVEEQFRLYVRRHTAVLQEVITERIATELENRGPLDHSASWWFSVLVDQVGITGKHIREDENLDAVRESFVRIAAIAVGAVDWIDRGAADGPIQ